MSHEIIDILLSIPAETETIEFKRVWENSNSKILQSIVSFANTDGWKIVIWIDDPEKTKLKWVDRIFWIEENEENYDALIREISKIIPPFNLYKIDKYTAINWKTVVIINIDKSQESFHSWSNQVFIRQRKWNKQLTPQEIIHYSYAKWFQKADLELVDINFDLLDNELYKKWKEARDIYWKDISDIFYKVWLARKDNTWKLKPTRAAVLLFSEYPNDILDTKSSVRIFKYSWTVETIWETPNLLSTPKTINWPIIEQIKKTHEYVLSSLESWLTIKSWFTIHYQIPSRAVKEAITNAIIHRDYHLQRDIEIRIFEDRVEIDSPWLFPANITKNNIWKVRSLWYRNSLLVKHLREFPNPPNLDQNEWVRAMRTEMWKENLYPPIFMTYPVLNDSVRVILFNEKIATEWERVELFLQKNTFITNEEAREITHISQRDKMSRLLKQWVEKWLLIPIIPESWYMRWVKYKLSQNNWLID